MVTIVFQWFANLGAVSSRTDRRGHIAHVVIFYEKQTYCDISNKC